MRNGLFTRFAHRDNPGCRGATRGGRMSVAFRSPHNGGRRSAPRHRRLFALVSAAILVAACGSAPPSATLPVLAVPGGSSVPSGSAIAGATVESGAPSQGPSANPSTSVASPAATGPASAPVLPSHPTSFELIAAARASGQITVDQALLDELFATTGDNRLPAGLRGLPSHAGMPTADMAALDDALPTMPPDLRAEAAPFFLPPSDPDSAWDQVDATAVTPSVTPQALVTSGVSDQVVGHVVAAASSAPIYQVLGATQHVKVWYVPAYGDGNRHAAQIVLDEAETIWSKETALLGPQDQPVSDASLPQRTPPVANGGDGLLDLYVGHTGHLPGDSGIGNTIPYLSPAVGPMPVFILISDSQAPDVTPEGKAVTADDLVRATAAHELFHAFQYAIAGAPDDTTSGWWWEATATWAEDYVYPGQDSEQLYLDDWTADPGPPPLTSTGGDTYEFESPEYTNYVFPFYLAQVHGASIIGAIWNAMANGTSVFDAIDGQTDFDDAFRQYALWAWDEPGSPADQLRDHGDRIEPDEHGEIDQHDIPGIDPLDDHQGHWKLDLISSANDLPGRSVAYYVIDDPGPDAHELKIEWGGLSGSVQMQALTKLKGQTAYQPAHDWSGTTFQTFCLDKPDENVNHVVLIVSNPGDQPVGGPITVDATGQGCGSGSGTATFSAHAGITSKENVQGIGTSGGTYAYAETDTASFELKRIHPDGEDPNTATYELMGNVSATMHGSASFRQDLAAGGHGSLDEEESADQSVMLSPPDGPMALLTLSHDPTTGQDSYELEQFSAQVTPTFNLNARNLSNITGGTCADETFDNGSGVIHDTQCSGASSSEDTANGPVAASLGFPPDSSALSGTYDAKSGQISATDEQASTDCSTVISPYMAGTASPILGFRGNPWDLVALAGPTLSCQGGSTVTVSINVPATNPPSSAP
jgi:hypothetical protein